MSGRDAAVVELVHATVSGLRADLGRRSLADSILDACGRLGYGSDEEPGRSRPASWANVLKFVRIADEFERISPGDAGAFLEYLKVRETHMKRERQGSIADRRTGAVRIMSVHSAKGLEFPVVAFADLAHKAHGRSGPSIVFKERGVPTLAMKLPAGDTGKRFTTPSFERLAAAQDEMGEEEAKRLFYVACTRAEEALIMCGTAALDKPPGASTALDRLRRALAADPEAQGLPNTTVTIVRPDGDLVSADGGAPAERRETLPAGSADGAECGPLLARAKATARVASGRESIPPPAELSFTALAQYEACPYRFYAQRVLGVGAVVLPGQGGPLDLGNAVHAALRVRALLGEVDGVRLNAIARRHGLDDAASTRLRDAVDSFAATSLAGRAAAAGASHAEAPFMVRVGSGTLVGSLDLLFHEGATAVVVDYKTGVSDLSEELARERYERQAQCYALAAMATGATRTEVHFVEVERGARTTSFAFGSDDVAAAGREIAGLFARMESGEFGRRNAFEPHICGDCPVSGSLCPVTPPSRGAASADRTPRRCPPPARS